MKAKQQFTVLHERAKRVARAYRNAESTLIEILQELDESGGYRWLGCKSLFEYTTRELGMSESVSYNLIAVARKGKQVPELIALLKEQKITLSAARMITPVLEPENKTALLQAAAALPKRQLEKMVATIDPRLTVQERISYASKDRLELKTGISERLSEDLERAREIVSSRLQKKANIEETLEVLVELFLSKEDPLRKAARAASKSAPSRPAASSKPTDFSEAAPLAPPSRDIPAAIKHQVVLRDRNQCTLSQPDGSRCPERKWLEIHHLVPLSRGGPTSVENLATICRSHHQLIHWNEQTKWNGQTKWNEQTERYEQTELKPPLRQTPFPAPGS